MLIYLSQGQKRKKKIARKGKERDSKEALTWLWLRVQAAASQPAKLMPRSLLASLALQRQTQRRIKRLSGHIEA